MIAEVAPDPLSAEALSRDPNDDYLIALARDSACDLIVSGDADLLVVSRPPDVLTPRELLDRIPGR